MLTAMNKFQEKLLSLYEEDNAKYSPFALWKMQKMTGEGEAFYLPEHECYYAIRNKQLLFYASPDEKCHIPLEELNMLDFICVKKDIFDTFRDGLEGFDISYGSSLFYDFNYIPQESASKKYEAVDFDFNAESHFQTAADIINGDENGGFTPQRLKRWMAFPSFDTSLWFFVKDIEAQKLVAVGISTFHKTALETDLDWIYVLPEYQGKGAGRFLIEEIIGRSVNRSKVIRVGGVASFYKKCGFYDREYWGFAVKPGFSMNEQ
ncbi:MAG: hypothetical protein K0S55_1960 [Clostridia bacterium]|nr:hypothetical protein [Clostridia bacterium]